MPLTKASSRSPRAEKSDAAPAKPVSLAASIKAPKQAEFKTPDLKGFKKPASPAQLVQGEHKPVRAAPAAAQTPARERAPAPLVVDPSDSHALRAKYDRVPINTVWVTFQETRSEEIRNYLWEKFLPLVRYNAERIHTRLPDEVDVDDLIQAGMFGLMDAISLFDVSRNIKFETYCAQRIRGAILDELRSMDWVPRLVRHRSSKVERARQEIEKRTGQPASDDDVARLLNVTGEESDKLFRDSKAVSTRSLSARTFTSDNGSGREVREIDVIRDESQSNPLSEIQGRDLKDLLTKGLTRAERLIILLYYFEGMTMKEIGLTLDLSESRVSQMHSSILARLKAQMQHRERELEPVK